MLRLNEIAERVIQISHYRGKVHLEQAIREVFAVEFPDEEGNQLDEHAENYAPKIRDHLGKLLYYEYERKVVSSFRFSDYDHNLIISQHTHRPETEVSKFRFTNDVNSFLKRINPSDFEVLGKLLLEMAGITSFVTQKSKDEGIDFGGIMRIEPDLFEAKDNFPLRQRILQNQKLGFIGQAKRYSNHVEVKDLRELVGSTQDRILMELCKKHPNDEVIKELLLPIPKILIFITTGYFSRDSKSFAENVGMLTLDGHQISQALLEIGLGCKRNEEGCWELDTLSITDWINRDRLAS